MTSAVGAAQDGEGRDVFWSFASSGNGMLPVPPK